MNPQLSLDLPPTLPPAIARRIRDARKSGRMSVCACEVLKMLANPLAPRLGRKNPMPISAMQERWRVRHERIYSDRLIKAAVKQMLEDHEIPVGSSRVTGRSGYFLCQSKEDLDLAERALKAEVFSLARRLRAINPNSLIARQLAGQIEIGRADDLLRKGRLSRGHRRNAGGVRKFNGALGAADVSAIDA